MTYNSFDYYHFHRNVIINLSRRTKDLDIDQNTEGILEIVGFSNDTPKIIDAYAKNLFK